MTTNTNNFTTLYSAIPSSTTNSTNYTTLYSASAKNVLPSLPYGNANVEAFLNAGTDGGNTILNIVATGSVTAETYFGDGGNLSNISGANVSGPVSTANTVVNAYQPNITQVGTLTTLSVNGNASVNGNITADYFLGNFVGNISGNLVVPGTNTSILFNNDGNAGASSDFTFNKDTQNVTANGNIIANFYYGNGYHLSHLNVANVSGLGNIATINLDGNSANVLYGNGVFATAANATNANYANFAGTAFNVSGSNVSGDVSGANHANVADTANNVSGSNVSGYVANATHATVADSANSVAAANVSGLGNLAFINKDGNASNVLYGNGVFATLPTSTYGNSNVASFLANYGSNTMTTTGNVSVGNIIGNGQALTGINGANVTGQVSYAATANSVAVANVVVSVTSLH